MQPKKRSKFLKKTFNGTEKIAVRPNWIINSQYENLISRESNRILAVGRLENQKNFKYLINSFTNSDFVIDIVGIVHRERRSIAHPYIGVLSM